jgi:hypothetical protein
MHKKSVEHVKFIVAYYFECGITCYSYKSRVSMALGQYLYDNGVSPTLPIALLKVHGRQPVVKESIFFCYGRASIVFILVCGDTPLSRLFGRLFSLTTVSNCWLLYSR